MTYDRPAIADFRKYSGEPNRRQDLEAMGLVRQGDHRDTRTATIAFNGVQREIPVRAYIPAGEDVTVLKPIKRPLRTFLWDAGDRSLRFPR